MSDDDLFCRKQFQQCLMWQFVWLFSNVFLQMLPQMNIFSTGDSSSNVLCGHRGRHHLCGWLCHRFFPTRIQFILILSVLLQWFDNRTWLHSLVLCHRVVRSVRYILIIYIEILPWSLILFSLSLIINLFLIYTHHLHCDQEWLFSLSRMF